MDMKISVTVLEASDMPLTLEVFGLRIEASSLTPDSPFVIRRGSGGLSLSPAVATA